MRGGFNKYLYSILYRIFKACPVLKMDLLLDRLSAAHLHIYYLNRGGCTGKIAIKQDQKTDCHQPVNCGLCDAIEPAADERRLRVAENQRAELGKLERNLDTVLHLFNLEAEFAAIALTRLHEHATTDLQQYGPVLRDRWQKADQAQAGTEQTEFDTV